MSNPNPLDLNSVLLWLATIGAPIVTGYVVSLLAENFPAWHTLDPRMKMVLPLVFSILLSVGAQLLLQNTQVVAMLQPSWTILMIAILAYFGTQQGYMSAKRNGYGEWARARALQSRSFRAAK